jgi:hypothetical protein
VLGGLETMLGEVQSRGERMMRTVARQQEVLGGLGSSAGQCWAVLRGWGAVPSNLLRCWSGLRRSWAGAVAVAMR